MAIMSINQATPGQFSYHFNGVKLQEPGNIMNDAIFANYGMRVDINGFVKLSDEDVERIAKAVVKEIFPILKVINAE